MLLLVFGLQATVAEAGNETPPRVLYINSYHPGYCWSDSLAEGIFDTLKGKTAIYTEYLDAKRPDFEACKDVLKPVMALKYKDAPIDLVITSDDAAFQFVKENRDSLFPDLPIVTCGINYMTPDILAECPGATGVMEGGHPPDTARLALGLFPKTQQIVFLTDYEYGDRADAQIETIKKALGSKVAYLHIQQQPDTHLDDIVDKLKTLNTPSVVIFFGFASDIRLGEEAQAMHRLVDIGLPFFVFDQRFVHYGALGGIVQDGHEQGATAARMALKIIDGAPINQVPPVFKAIDKKVFNYGQLKRFGLLGNPLVEEASLVGAPDKRIGLYRKFMALGIVFIVLEAALIAGLIRLNRIRKKTAHELEAARDRAEVAAKAKSEFLMMVSHEFRTPLNAIEGFTELLSDETDPDTREEYSNHIKESSACLLGIVEDILEYTNVSPEGIDAEACTIAEHLDALVKEYQPTARKQGLDLEFVSFFRHSPCLYLHWPYLKLALCKLLDNSIKFSKQGRIQVVLDEQLQSLRDRAFTISVIDQGPGFDEEQIELIMELFSQEEDYLTREHTGLGLGLALCHRIVTALGGVLECTSQPHEETVFKIVLPQP